MNNSFIAIENVSLELETPVDNTVVFRQKESELVAIIEALQKVSESPEWLLLKDKIFDGVVQNLKNRRDTEVEKKPLNGPVIHSLNGQLEWAKKYSDLSSLVSIYKQELINVRNRLNGNI